MMMRFMEKKFNGKRFLPAAARLEMTKPALSRSRHRRRCLCRFSAKYRVDAPAAGAVEENKKEKPAVKHRFFALIDDGKEFRHRVWRGGNMKHEISHGHRTTADEC